MNAFPLNSRLLAALLIFFAVFAYIPAIGAGYIWDDDILLTANSQVHDPHGLPQIWEGKNSRDYTPLTTTGFWLEWRLWGGSPMGCHIVNILLHALAAVLLWRILLVLGIPGAWLAALLFAIHPVNVASVAWIAELKNTLSSVFFLGSILAFLSAQKRTTSLLYVASILCFLLAGLAKGAVVILPVVLVGCILWMEKKITRRDILRLVPFALIALAIACLTIRYQSRAEHYGLQPDTMQFRIARAGIAVWWYLGRIIFPIGLSPMAPQWHPDLHSPIAYLPAVAVLALLALFFWKRKSWGRPFLFASGYYLLILLPVLGFVWMTLQQETPATDWWQYMAAPGIMAGFSAALVTFLKNRGALFQIIPWVLISFLLLFQTSLQAVIYDSMETYCSAVVAENPHAWTMQNNLGVVLKRQGKFPAAIACYRQSLADNPRFVEARNNLANALGATGDFAGAETEFQEALKLRPENPELLAGLAQVYFHGGKIHDAIATQAGAIKADENNPQYYTRFGLMLAANKQYPQAVVCFKKSLLLDPGNVDTRIDLIRGLLVTGQREEAAALCQQALRAARKSNDEKQIQLIGLLLDQATQTAVQQ